MPLLMLLNWGYKLMLLNWGYKLMLLNWGYKLMLLNDSPDAPAHVTQRLP